MSIQGLDVVEGRLVPVEALEEMLLPKTTGLIDDATATISYGNSDVASDDDRSGVVVKSSGGDALVAYATASELVLAQYSFGEFTELHSISLDETLSDHEYFLTAAYRSNSIIISRWDEDPSLADPDTDPDFTFTFSLTGAVLSKFGKGKPGRYGIYIRAASDSLLTMWLDNFNITTIVLPSTQVSVFNKGNYRAKCVITFVGPIAGGFIINNAANGIQFGWSAPLSAGEILIMDSFNDTITDASGEDRFDGFDFTSELMLLAPGLNSITLVPEGAIGAEAGIKSIEYFDTWM